MKRGRERAKYNDGPLVALALVLGINLALYLARLEYSGALDDEGPPALTFPAAAEMSSAAEETRVFLRRSREGFATAAAAAAPNAALLEEHKGPSPDRTRHQVLLEESEMRRRFRERALPGREAHLLGANASAGGFLAQPRRVAIAPAPRKPPTFHSEDMPLPEMYGTGPVIRGLDFCEAFRVGGPPHTRRWAPAGMFNCGTNTLLSLMRINCMFTKLGRHTLWQVPWGKHNPVAWRGTHWANQFQGENWKPKIPSVMPVVVVKDPLTWMKSMCRNQYATRFRHVREHLTDQCPSPVVKTSAIVYYQPTQPHKYESMVHFWAEWNAAWLNATFPRLIVRYEDVLFDSKNVVTKLCDCVGGTMRPHFRQTENVAKDAKLGHRGKVNDREAALELYGDEAKRYEHYTDADLAFTQSVASPLLEIFDYGFATKNPFTAHHHNATAAATTTATPRRRRLVQQQHGPRPKS